MVVSQSALRADKGTPITYRGCLLVVPIGKANGKPPVGGVHCVANPLQGTTARHNHEVSYCASKRYAPPSE